jgi:hypothetical protein
VGHFFATLYNKIARSPLLLSSGTGPKYAFHTLSEIGWGFSSKLAYLFGGKAPNVIVEKAQPR